MVTTPSATTTAPHTTRNVLPGRSASVIAIHTVSAVQATNATPLRDRKSIEGFLGFIRRRPRKLPTQANTES
jgi:hypothetical protein